MKKLFLLVPVVVLLAAGCGSSSTQPSSTPSTNQSINQPASNSTPPSAATSPAGSMNSPASAGDTWQATLMASNNAAKGNYMITVSGHTIYLNTSRDYSSLVGKAVNVSYAGNLNSFSLVNITAQ